MLLLCLWCWSHSFWFPKSCFAASNRSLHSPQISFTHLWFTVFVKLYLWGAELICNSKICIQCINICIWSYCMLGRICRLASICSNQLKRFGAAFSVGTKCLRAVPNGGFVLGFLERKARGSNSLHNNWKVLFQLRTLRISQKPSSKGDDICFRVSSRCNEESCWSSWSVIRSGCCLERVIYPWEWP